MKASGETFDEKLQAVTDAMAIAICRMTDRHPDAWAAIHATEAPNRAICDELAARTNDDPEIRRALADRRLPEYEILANRFSALLERFAGTGGEDPSDLWPDVIEEGQH
jgi:hypothetical protein